MPEMKLNGIKNQPARADLASKRAEKRPEDAGTSGQRSVKAAFEQPAGRRTDTLILSRQAAAQAKSAKQVIGGAPQRTAGESDEHWARRLISYETASSWRASSRQWQEESKHMGIVDSVRYRRQKAAEWVTGLMEQEPAMFREWLNREKWHMEEGGLDNAIVPEGFTQEDFSRWMEKDVLDYL